MWKQHFKATVFLNITADIKLWENMKRLDTEVEQDKWNCHHVALILTPY
jgi:hypothetical protein